MAAKLCYAFALTHELDLGQTKLLTFGEILGRFAGQIGLPKRSVDDRVNHDGYLRAAIFSPAVAMRNQADNAQLVVSGAACAETGPSALVLASGCERRLCGRNSEKADGR
jgi:hypothetical protein